MRGLMPKKREVIGGFEFPRTDFNNSLYIIYYQIKKWSKDDIQRFIKFVDEGYFDEIASKLKWDERDAVNA
ncbi:MAG: hypothetical protein ACYTBX_18540 [Planctomycetota bacterium]